MMPEGVGSHSSSRGDEAVTNDAEPQSTATMVVNTRRPRTDGGRRNAAMTASSPVRTAALLFIGFFALRWLFRSEYLINWDSVQLALGVEAFDLATHQPHPPGYIGYMLLGRVLAPIVGDVPGALTLISVVSGALAPMTFFLLARRMLPSRYAVASAVLFGVSPLLWHYSGVALTYAPEVALSLVFALFVHRTRGHGAVRDLMAATLTFAILGSVRQSALLLLAPLWLTALRGFSRRMQAWAVAVLGGACLAWAVPLIWASGGLASYIRESAALAELSVGRTAFITGAFTGLLQNIGILGIGIVIGMHATLFVLWSARRRPGGSLGALPDGDRRFLLAWAVVPALFFIFVHTGQPGYALLLMPVGYLWVGSALAQVIEHPAPADAATAGHGLQPSQRLATLWGVLSMSGVAAFFVLPSITYQAAASELMAEVQEDVGFPSPADRTAAHVTEAPSQSPLAQAVRQYSIPRHDDYWAELTEFIQLYAPESSAVLTAIGGPIISGSFRQLGYYRPEYRVYAVGWDRGGQFGYLFQTHHKESTYTVQGLETASNILVLPSDVRWVIIPDADVAALLDPSISKSTHELENGTVVTVAHVGYESVLEFHSEDDWASIDLR